MIRVLIVNFAAFGMLFGIWAYVRVQLPYNQQGRYFDSIEGVVYEYEVVLILGMISILCLGLPVGLFILEILRARTGRA